MCNLLLVKTLRLRLGHRHLVRVVRQNVLLYDL
jgi:hypothetical protein